MMKKILHKTFAVALLVMAASCASTERQIQHPPTYNDFIKLQAPNYDDLNADFFLRRIELMNCISACDNSEEKEKRSTEQIKKECIKNKEDEKIIEEIVLNLEFKKAIRFTTKEMNTIKQSGNLTAIVGAGVQSDKDEPLGTELLESASASESPTGLALVSLLDRYVALQAKETAASSLADKIQTNITKLLQADPDNALSYYLNGYILHIDKKDNEALQQLKEGNTKKEFSNYSKERFVAVVQAAESIGYSHFTARQHAINYSSPEELYSKLVAVCKGLISTDKKEDARKECLSMGEKIELSSGTNFEKLHGLIIQSLACRESNDPKDIELMSKIIERQKITLETSPKLLKIPFSEIPESVWLQYFEIYFSKDEKAAGSFIEDYYKKARQGNGK